jgi:aminopeptidase N
MKKISVLLAVLMVASCFVAAQRLPETATPSHYQITFTPNFNDNTFKGEETIDVRVLKPTNEITLNAAEISFSDVTITAGKKSQKAKVSLDDAKEMATLTVAEPIAAGAAQIKISYTGQLNSHLSGLYLSKTKQRKYAVTQFEATDARRAFPSFDEPAYKATFDISAVVDKGDTAISNGKIVKDTPGPGADKHTIGFSQTPKMSTYLVALTVGDWKCVEGEEEGTALRVCATPGKEQMGMWALESTKAILHYLNAYYGIKYPYGKLDQIAVPDFQAGAMENTAAIIYRESLLLADEKTASDDAKREIAAVASHEIAHQWFGDLVTMKWWNDIWLNEGFATWMATKPLDAWRPDWKVGVEEISENIGSMNADSVLATRPIRQTAESKSEINSLFDGIAYGKTAAVLRMLESYLGKDVFRTGVNNYLKAHAYGNATAEDFWQAMAAASKKPVDKIMPTFVVQPGVPYVDVATKCEGGNTKVTLSQKRYFYDPALFEKNSNELWQIPVCMKGVSADGTAGKQQCELMTQKEQTFQMSGCPAWVFTNSSANGYYRYGYQPDLLNKLGTKVEQALTPAERTSLVGNEWALVRAGQHKVSDFLALAEAMKNDRTRQVISQFIQRFQYINRNLLTEQTRPEFQKWLQGYLNPIMSELGYQAKPNESPEQTLLRAGIFGALGNLAEDPQVIAKARELVQVYIKDPASVDPTLADDVIAVAAAHGDEALYNQFMAELKTAKDPEQYYRYFYALASFRQPALLQRTLDYALTPEVRNQDLGIVSAVVGNPYGQQVGWEFITTHHDQLSAKLGASIGSAVPFVSVSSNFCDPALREQAKAYFEQHKKPGTPDRGFRSAMESINYCVEMKQRESTNLAQWLEKNASVAGGVQ